MALLSLAGCSHGATNIEAAPITGQVVDASGSPIPGAIVAAKWIGTFNSASESGTRCVRADSVQANNSGRFVVSGWNKPYVHLDNVQVVLVGYAPGYVDAVSPGFLGDGTFMGKLKVDAKDVVVQLRPFKGAELERRDFLSGVISGTSCEDPDSSGMQLLYKAIYAEAQRLPLEQHLPGHATLLEMTKELAQMPEGSNDTKGAGPK